MPDWFASMKGMPLTQREQQILDTLTTEASNQQIAQALGISLDTVRTHVLSLHRKLGVKTRIDLLVAAEKQGLI